MTDTHAIDATALEALAKRVEAGEAGREIDAEIWILLRSDEEYSKALRRVQEPSGCPDPHGEVAKWARGGWFAHKYSTSLDAVADGPHRMRRPPSSYPSGKSKGSDQ